MKPQGPRPLLQPRLRASHTLASFHVVLHEPEIPPNTGSVARTCAATDTPLHLIEPLGFRVDEHSVRRAGLDYWPLVKLQVHKEFAGFHRDFSERYPTSRVHVFSAHAQRSFYDADFAPGDALLFGKESVGLPSEVEERFRETSWAIPMPGKVRSLNLSNAVSIVLYEAMRRAGMFETIFVET